MNSGRFLHAWFIAIYNLAIGEIQMIDGCEAYANELIRLAECIRQDKRYKPKLEPLGFDSKTLNIRSVPKSDRIQ